MNPRIDTCPFLPVDVDGWTLERLRARGRVRDAEFFHAVCRCAQGLWQQGKPAQALLQLNRALAVEPRFVASAAELPYQAMRWIIQHAGERFIGNPVRHFQHLASRVNQPNRELRSWRAWACFHLASEVLDGAQFPRDEEQIASENLRIPAWLETLAALGRLGVAGEDELLGRLRLTARI
jgi:hypothetical protein